MVTQLQAPSKRLAVEGISIVPPGDQKIIVQDASFVLQAGNGLSGLLLDGEEMLSGPEFREKMKKHFSTIAPDADAATLATELRAAIEPKLAGLEKQSPEWYAQIVTRAAADRSTKGKILAGIAAIFTPKLTDSVADAYLAASLVKPGRAAAVVVKRDGKDVTVSVTPSKGY